MGEQSNTRDPQRAYKEALKRIEWCRAKKDTNLDLSRLGLETLPPEIGQLTALTTLNLAANQLTSLPAEIGQLTALETLNVDNNRVASLPSEIAGLTTLTTLQLGSNGYSEVPAEVFSLSGLKRLDLDNNRLTAVPPEIGRLTALTTLYLSSNKLSSLPPEIVRLTALTDLYLQRNQLSTLPSEIGRLTALKELYLHDNPGLGLPPEVLGPTREQCKPYGRSDPANPAEILAYYFRATREASRPLREAKILVLGQGAVGKTSLVKRLVEERFDSLEPKTDGISISAWALDFGGEQGTVRIKIWDFGGQEIMHATHQFFLTKRSLYLLVLDARKGEQESNLAYWLKISKSYGGDSPVLIVVNKCDEHPMQLNERAIQRQFPAVCGFVYASAKTGQGIERLREMIQTQIAAMPHVFSRVPAVYLEIKQEIETRASERDYLEAAEFYGLCKAHGLADTGEQKRLLRFLHDLGSVLNFDDPDDPYGLRDTKILNPEWVTGAVYRIINNPLLREQREGELELEQMGRILNDATRYPERHHRFIIEIMRKFELCFEFPNSGGTRYLVPELLPVREPELKWPDSGVLAFEYHYDVLPSGVLCRLIVRNAQHITVPAVYWRTGVVFRIRGNPCLVRAEADHRRMVIEVDGPPATRRDALATVRGHLEHIHATIPQLEARAMVPLPDKPAVVVAEDHLSKLQDLGVDRFVPEGADRQYMVEELLTGVLTPKETQPRTLHVRTVALKNIRCFDDLTIGLAGPGGFRSMTMLLGDNGAGKSTVLRCIAMALCDDTGASSLLAKLAGDVLHSGSDEGSIRLSCADGDGKLWEVQTTLKRTKGNSVQLHRVLPPDFPLGQVFVCGYGAARAGFGDKSYERYEAADAVRSLFDYTMALQNPEIVFRRVQGAGHSLDEFCRKLSELLELVPPAVRITGSGVTISGTWGEFTPAGAVGDGYQATLAWVVDFLGWALFYDDRFLAGTLSGIVLVDEIEKHLHPRWQRQIIKRLYELFPNVQFIVTSHSPICAAGLSDLPPDEGMLWHFPTNGEQPVQSIQPPAGWRYDEILTSSAFGLSSSRDVTTEAIQDRIRTAYEQHADKAPESAEFHEAMKELEARSVTAAQDETERADRAELTRELAAMRKILEAMAHDPNSSSEESPQDAKPAKGRRRRRQDRGDREDA